ncbi:hypothetical protein V7S43_010971 [Phytophthora oleae]|uniref:WW domain-containing protein n=1 Tax=Phytophthora oleae TaxID=2107226 RepID=A0ABD3FDS9_9STRA
MALTKSQPVEPGEGPRSCNNESHLTISSYERQDYPESSAKTSKTVDALLNTDAFVLDGEWFYDAVAVEGEDAFTSMNENTTFAYWGLQVDSKTQMVYYFSHSHPEEMQWLPPANLIHPDTHEVLLWDSSIQWSYYYNPQVGRQVAGTVLEPLTKHFFTDQGEQVAG